VTDERDPPRQTRVAAALVRAPAAAGGGGGGGGGGVPRSLPDPLYVDVMKRALTNYLYDPWVDGDPLYTQVDSSSRGGQTDTLPRPAHSTL